jgi:hypothetical protein
MIGPILPVVPITIEGTEYKLLFTFNAIADVEEMLLPAMPEINLLGAKWGALTAVKTRALFIAGLATHQPGLSFDERKRLCGVVCDGNLSQVVDAINVGYRNFMPEPSDAPLDPPTPGQ